MIIIQDTREKIPWNFIAYDNCKGQIIRGLSAGDYTLDGYPDLVCIERKKSVNEIASNLGTKYTQFQNEMERLQVYRFRYVICEFTEEQLLIYPKNSGLPKRLQKKLRMSGKFLYHRINELIDRFNIEFIFCENRFEAEDKALELLQRAKDIYDEETTITK